MNKYIPMLKTYYQAAQKPEAVKRELDRRLESPSVIQTGFMIGEHRAFIMNCDELVRLPCEILRLCRRFDHLSARTPRLLIQSLIRQEMIDEILQTNDLEGVHSTHKEISASFTAVEENMPHVRFEGMIKKYSTIASEEFASLTTCQDIRSLYDEFILDEVSQEDSDNIPDGVCFRKDPVSVAGAHGQTIHKGVYPEAAIMESMERALSFLNSPDYEPLISISAFHYMFGYVHPFYDGNGRISRFISAQRLVSYRIPALACLRLSYTIRKKRTEYYRLFKETNDLHNYGDMTGFVIGFLQIIQEAVKDTCDLLAEKVSRLEQYKLQTDTFRKEEGELLYLLCQLALADRPGVTFEELQGKIKDLPIHSGESHLRALLKNLGDYCIVERQGKRYVYRANLAALEQV